MELNMDKDKFILKEIPTSICQMVKAFPTDEVPLLTRESYFNYVVHYLLQMDGGKFLEIGYRKGVFTEVCKLLKISSVHLDITDKLLRASPTEDNKCTIIDSLEYLKSCPDVFSFIFQDGSKSFKYRWEEYKLIKERNLLHKDSYIVSDDLHYPDCHRAFDRAISDLGYEGTVIKARGSKKKKHNKYLIGILK